MKINLEALTGHNFILRLPLDDGRGDHVIALHDARRLRGVYEHDAVRFALDPVEADAILGEITWLLSNGTLHLAGPLALGATRLDLDIRRDDQTPGITGNVRCASFDAPTLQLQLGVTHVHGSLSLSELDVRHDTPLNAWRVILPAIKAQTFSIQHESIRAVFESLSADTLDATVGATTTVTLAEVVAKGVSLALQGIGIKLATVTISGIRVEKAGALTLEADTIELKGVEFDRGEQHVKTSHVTLGAFRYSPEGITFGRLEADAMTLSILGLQRNEQDSTHPAPEDSTPVGTRRTLGIDLPFLDQLTAKIEADVVVDIKLPVITRRVATHRMRLAVDNGTFDFKQLEHGLSRLEDSILDFEVVPEGLELEVDAVVVKRQILLWPMNAEGIALARRNRVRMRTFAMPTMLARAPSPKETTEGESRVALHRVEVQALRVEGSVQGTSTLPVAGGTLHLGTSHAPALALLHLGGTLVHDITQVRPDTELSIEIKDLELALDAIKIGERSLTVNRIHLGHLAHGRIAFHGFSPKAFHGDIQTLILEKLTLQNH
jgi:hypothetical protein